MERESEDIVKVQWWSRVRTRVSCNLAQTYLHLQNDAPPEHFRIHVKKGKHAHLYFRPGDDSQLKTYFKLNDETPFHAWDHDSQNWLVTFATSPPQRVHLGETLYFKHTDVVTGVNLPKPIPATPALPLHKRQKSSLSESPVAQRRMKMTIAMEGDSNQSPILILSDDESEKGDEPW